MAAIIEINVAPVRFTVQKLVDSIGSMPGRRTIIEIEEILRPASSIDILLRIARKTSSHVLVRPWRSLLRITRYENKIHPPPNLEKTISILIRTNEITVLNSEFNLFRRKRFELKNSRFAGIIIQILDRSVRNREIITRSVKKRRSVGNRHN